MVQEMVFPSKRSDDDRIITEIIGSPMKLSHTPIDKPSAPPFVGEHTDKIFKEDLDLSLEEIEDLRANHRIS